MSGSLPEGKHYTGRKKRQNRLDFDNSEPGIFIGGQYISEDELSRGAIMSKNLIIDCEVHLLHPEARKKDYLQGSFEPARFAIHEHEEFDLVQEKPSVESLLQSMDECQIAWSCIMGLSWCDKVANDANNRYIEECIAHHPDRLKGLYIPHLESVKQAIASIEQLDSNKFLGVKLLPSWQGTTVDQEVLQPLFDCVRERGMFLMVHTDHPTQSLDGDTPYRFLQFVKRNPELKILAPHLGGMICLYQLHEPLRPYFQNVYFISSVSATLQFVEFAERICSDNILFGTDYPYNHSHSQQQCIDGILELDISLESKRKILGATAGQLFELEV